MDGHLPVSLYNILTTYCILLYSILLCVERCGLIAHWAKLVFLHLGEQSEPGANVAPCGSLNGITMADRLRLSDFNGIVQGNSQESLLNAVTWERLSNLQYMFAPAYKAATVQPLCWSCSQSAAVLQESVYISVSCVCPETYFIPREKKDKEKQQLWWIKQTNICDSCLKVHLHVAVCHV